MNDSTSREETLDALGPILIKQEYEWVELDKVATAAAVEVSQISSEFPSKSLLCEAWMERTDEKARRQHSHYSISMRPVPDSCRIIVLNQSDGQTIADHCCIDKLLSILAENYLP